MYCKYCGKEIIEGATFCNNCGKPVNKDGNSAYKGAKSSSEKRGISKILIFAVVAIVVLFMVVFALGGKSDSEAPNTEQTEQTAYLPNYEKYLGKWKVVGDIGHPDGNLARYGNSIEFTNDGISCCDLFALDTSWSYIDALVYYNDDGNDYYVDPTGDPMGFYYDASAGQMIIFTPSENNPSSNPYEWNSRIRLER